MKNRMLFPQLFALAGLSLCTDLACRGQPSAAPAPNNALTRPVQLTPAAEDKDKAEDAALLQQLESDAQQNKNEHRTKGQFPPTALVRGGGGVAAAGAGGGIFNGQNFMVHGQDFVTRGRPAASALVIQTSESDPKTQTALEEDLAVMSHLLNKALEDLPGGPRHAGKVMGIDVFFAPGGAPLRSLYLDNYGAVFFLNVNFPLIPPAEKRAEEKPTGDSVWEEAREELYGQRAGGGGEPAEEYSQEKVEKLKETLFDSLKNASNIRGLKPNECVTLWVCGGTSNGGRVRVVKANQPAAKGVNVVSADQVFPAGRRTILTIRARKGDIDDYAKGKLGPEEFQKRAQLTAYTGGGGGGSPESLLMGYTPRNGF